MKQTEQIARNIRGVYFGPNWTAANLKDKLEGVSWEQAVRMIRDFHSIATLVFHVNYYVEATVRVLRGGPLNAQDKFSFDCPPIESEQQWNELVAKAFADAEEMATLVEALPDERLSETFVEEKNGTYFRCLMGPVEHTYYHLGQISLIKSILQSEQD